jgi:AraC family transcriptional regulator, glycine betaine-responsive activator
MTGLSSKPVRLAFLLVPQFSLMAFSSAIEPLRAANRLFGRQRYSWKLTSIDGKPVLASNGLPVTVQSSLDELARPDMLVVCAALEPLQFAGDRRLCSQLRSFARQGTRIGAISGGSFILADAGLLNGRRCTVHWEYADVFAVRYPNLALSDDIYVIDGNVFTCSGGTAALDMMLHFVSEHCGSRLALAVADQFIHPRIREQGDHQRMAAHVRYRLFNPKLAEVIRMMEGAVQDKLDMRAIAKHVELSARQVERLFRRYVGVSPSRFHLQLRLKRGRSLLLETSQTVQSIALECGFESPSHFCHVYKRIFGLSPSATRQREP